MSAHIGLSSELSAYVLQHTRESDVARRLRAETAALSQAQMLTTPDQAQFLAFLVRMLGATRILEVGTFTGYSALAMAEALPEHGSLTACDVSAEFTSIARRYWQQAGVEKRIDLRLAPALQTLKALQESGQQFDLMFIDADKMNYDAYYEAGLTLVRTGGLIALDNMLWKGEVADKIQQDKFTEALRALNAKILTDARVDCSLLTVADGMMLALKKQ